MFIEIDELRIHYNTAGIGQDVLFLPGWAANIGTYESLFRHLQKKFRVTILDWPGCGLSGTLPEVWEGTKYADLVYNFITLLKLDKPIVIGHSLGGKVALLLAAKYPHLFTKLILINSAGIRSKLTLKLRCKILLFKVFKKVVYWLPLGDRLRTKIEAYKNKFGSNDYRNASGIMRATLVKLVAEDFREILPKIKLPTLLIWGDQDKSTPIESGRLMASLLANADLQVINNVGHFPHLENFQATATVLDNFIDK